MVRRSSVPPELKEAIPHKDFCLVCGSVEKLTVDHIVPVSKGGAEKSKRNLMILCSDCNKYKADLEPLVWLEKLQTFDSLKENYCPLRWLVLRTYVYRALKAHAERPHRVFLEQERRKAKEQSIPFVPPVYIPVVTVEMSLLLKKHANPFFHPVEA